MKTTQFVLRTAALAFLLIFSLSGFAQMKAGSPRDSVSGKIGKATIAINYGSPSVKGRKIWGDLVPYGQVWRTGANEATTFKTDMPIQVGGKTLPAGTYAFFAIPGEKTWTIIFNKTAKQWGSFKYDKKDDALRVDVTPKKSASMNERLVYKINSDGISLIWENLEVPVGIK
jgi:hypothetical protein